MELAELVRPVTGIAQRAGAAILEVYDDARQSAAAFRGGLLQNKADASPLTLADLAAHQVITQELQACYPALAIVSEEGAVAPKGGESSPAFWLVDPLDGTKEFLARNGEFTVNIALISGGVPVFGVVHVPVTGDTYWGGKGLGAYRRRANDVQPICVATPVAAGCPYRVVASKSHLNAATRAYIDTLGPVQLIQAGSSLKFCRIAEGQADIYPRLGPTCEWDTAAAHAVLDAAGGVVVDLAGQALRYGKVDIRNPEFIAASSDPVGRCA